MQFSEQWLRAMVDPALTTDELVHLLTMSGLEVEEVRPVAPAWSGIIVGHVLSVERHPNADKLSVCRVDAGRGEPLQIVCGAPNVSAGMKAPLAVVGAWLAGESPDKPFEIRVAKMRGVESHGMLCSARELGLSDDHSGLLALAADAPVGADVRDVLGLGDSIITIKLTPNRADALSVLGIAREVAALTGAPLTPPAIPPVPAASDRTHPVRISAPEGCGRFTGRVIRNVNAAAPSPEWMKRRLERAGQRPISALVDVTNYVMLELGRPLHVYDLAKLRGAIDVRFGRAREQVKLLNEQTVEVDDTVLCITDDSGPIGLAGIMGGDSTKADLDTRDVFLESAFFFPEAIAGRARRYNFTSDASHRFERGVDFDNNVAGIERATQLIIEICGGVPGPTTDLVARLPERKPVCMRVARARKVIGVDIHAGEMASIFARLGLAAVREGAGENEVFVVTPPSYRFDIEIEEDLIEEVARVYGFERIPAHPPVSRAAMHVQPESRRSLHALRERLAAADYTEVLNFGFVEPAWEADFAGNADPIKLLNPIASQLSVMRSSLLGGLIANIRYNINRKAGRARVFEIARVFERAPGTADGSLTVAGLHQPMRVGAAAFGPAAEQQWGQPTRPVDFFDVKGDLDGLIDPLRARFDPAIHPALHPRRAARVLIDGTTVGWIGELHPKWQRKYELPGPVVVMELDAEPLQRVPLPAYEEVSRFPPVIRDRSVELPDAVPAQAVLDELDARRPAVVRDLRLFDLYRGKGVEPGRKSLAFRVVMQDTARTLTDAEADQVMDELTRALETRFGAKLRI